VAATLYTLAPSPEIRTSDVSAGVEIARRYYDAINHMIASGDSTPLYEVVDSEMIELDPPGAGFDGREGTARYLRFLHATAPDTRIEPASITEHRGQVIVHVSVRHLTPSTMLGIALDDQSPRWPAVELLRVARGQIVERQASWAGMVALTPETDLPFDLAIPHRRELVAALNHFGPRTMWQYVTIDAPEILRMLAGGISIELSDSALEPLFVLAPTGNAENTQQRSILPGQIAEVGPGDVVIIPPGTAFTITNHLDRKASVMHLSAAIPHVPDGNPESLARSVRLGIVEETLAWLQSGDLDGPAQISFGTATLMPGARLETAAETELLIACSMSGTLHCVHYQPGSEGDGMVRVYKFLDGEEDVAPMLLLTRESGRDVLLNAGNQTATAWIIAVSST
jgi:hypothetical protein